MAPNLAAVLSRDEFASLQEIGNDRRKRIIPGDHRDRLISLGYIVELPGGLELTAAGHVRLAAGR
jgi:hypothetical protein